MKKKDLINKILNEAVDERFSQEAFQMFINTLFKTLNINSPKFLGKGYNGIAYSFENKVLKITKDESEAEIKYALMANKELKHLPSIYKVYRINLESLGKFGYDWSDNIFIIIQEYVNNLNQEYLHFFDTLEYVLDWRLERYPDNIRDYIELFDGIKSEIKKRYLADGLQLNLNLVREFRELLQEMYKLNIDSIDFKVDNFGINESGRLTFFDIGFGSGGLYIKDEIII